MLYKGGAMYEGRWRGGRWSGHGRLQYSPGHVFEGEFKDGQRADGPGALRCFQQSVVQSVAVFEITTYVVVEAIVDNTTTFCGLTKCLCCVQES